MQNRAGPGRRPSSPSARIPRVPAPVNDNAFVRRAPAAGALALVFTLISFTGADPDLWGHLRFGLDMLATQTLPSADPYSFTQDRPWINHEWLSELAMGLAWVAGGVPGLVLLKAVLVAAALFLVWHTLSRIDFGPRIVILGTVATAIAPIARTLRPQLWTLLFLVLLTRLLVERRIGWSLPIVFALWANLHGGWIVGLGVLAVWLAADALVSRRIDLRASVIAAVSVLATLLTPYGVGLWTFLATTVRMGRDITEWQPLWNSPAAGSAAWLAAAVATVLAIRLAPADRLPRLAVLGMLAFSSARVIRIVPLFVVCAAVLLADAFAVRWPRRAGRLSLDPSPHDRTAAAVILLATCGLSLWLGTKSFRCIGVDTPRAADQAAVGLLRGAAPGRLVTFFDWGEYAIWHLGPAVRVSMDGRRETVYSDARLEEHAAILEGRRDGLAALAVWRPEYVWLPATSARTREWLVAEGYRVEHESDQSFVAVRADLPSLAPPTPAPPSATACFPG